eukprot:EG_transcript_52830
MYNNVKRQEAILNPSAGQKSLRPATAPASASRSVEARDPQRGAVGPNGPPVRASSDRALQSPVAWAPLAVPSRKTITDGLRRIEDRDKGDLDAWVKRCTAFSTQLNTVHRKLEKRV